MFKVFVLSLFATVPTSTNYQLPAYDFGNGGATSSSSSYQLRSQTGSPGGSLSSGSYKLPAGVKASMTAPVPPAPTLTNPDSSYNRLKIVLSTAGFASDTKYLIAISSDNFVTTKYVQLDQTIGSSLSVANYQTYAAWGGASGIWILGLSNATTYQVKVAALQGSGTGSAFGPTASAATSTPSVTFAVTTSLTATPPFSVTFASLPAGSVTSGDASVIANVTTNAENGGSLLLKDGNGGLTSSSKAYTIPSASVDLTSANSGYGAQVSGVSQTSGGPVAAVSPFNGSSNSVGVLSSSWQQLASFSNPITSGNVTMALKAKTDITVPAAADFSDTLTLALSLLF
jgi:hypothetical protein